MKIHPSKQIRKEIIIEDKKLNGTERITKVIAMVVAFVSVYYFLIKILFL